MHNNKQKACIFFLAPGKGPALPGMPDVETLRPAKCQFQHNRAYPEEEANQ